MISSKYYDYFLWLTSQIDCLEFPVESYSVLLEKLFSIQFRPIVATDEDRAGRGLERRRDYILETGDYLIDDKPCSMLEMMIALAYDCEDYIMHEPGKDQIPTWFWGQIESLGFLDMTNDNYDDSYVYRIVMKYLAGRYNKDGHYGLFWCKGYPRDLRGETIWFQLNRWLDTKYDFSL